MLANEPLGHDASAGMKIDERYLSVLRPLKDRRGLVALVAISVIGALLWWRFGRGPEVTTVAPSRGTAVEIVYATGTVEPVRWAKVASLIRHRIVDLCYCEGKFVARAIFSRASMIERCGRSCASSGRARISPNGSWHARPS